MKQIMQSFLLYSTLLALSACASIPRMFWDTDGNGQPAYARGSSNNSGAESRPLLEVPPELRAELEVPETADTGKNTGDVNIIPKQYRKTVAGKAVALHARLYDARPERLFSAVVDAMTALNMPVDSVDSPSGVITTEWIRRSSARSGGMLNLDILGDMFGGSAKKAHRYRFIVRIFKLNADAKLKSRLEVRLLSQVLINRHWVNRPIKNKPALKLFSTVEKQLGRTQPQSSTP